MKRDDGPFFVGYLDVPPRLRSFLLATGLGLIALFAAIGLVIGATQDDPGEGAYRFDFGRQTVTGVIEMLPYPVLHVIEGTDRLQPGHTIMLVDQGKNGVADRAAPLLGEFATASGIVLRRGDLDMLQLRGGQEGLHEADGTAVPPPPIPLGRWRLTGEICDGKCLAGAMRPGRGLAHKACAELCLIGDIPPVFVSTQPVEGSEYLMVLGSDGGPMPQEAYDHVASYITVEGDVSRHGDLLVFRLDPASIEMAQ